MRLFLFSIAFIPTICFGIGPDACYFEGEVNGNKVKLDWIYIPATDPAKEGRLYWDGYGLSDSNIYGFCTTAAEGEYHTLRCATSKGGKETVTYINKENLTYLCSSGCKNGIVKKFIYVCHGD